MKGSFRGHDTREWIKKETTTLTKNITKFTKVLFD